MVVSIAISTDFNLNAIASNYSDRVEQTIIQTVRELARELERLSPVGETSDLKNSWDVLTKGDGLSIEAILINDAQNSYFRLAGRAPGKRPPARALFGWAAKVLGDRNLAYPVARNIGLFGTQRWRDKDNILGLDPVTSNPNTFDYGFQSQSIIKRYEKILIDRIEAIQIN